MYRHHPLEYHCPFCEVAKGVEQEGPWTKRSDVVLQTDSITALISSRWWPNNPGHVLVIPNAHYENVYEIPDELLQEVQVAGKRVAQAMKVAYRCDGTSFRQHNEPAGNQDVWHYHLHVFPRYHGDDLYRLSGHTTSPEDRQPYADLLRGYFASHVVNGVERAPKPRSGGEARGRSV